MISKAIAAIGADWVVACAAAHRSAASRRAASRAPRGPGPVAGRVRPIGRGDRAPPAGGHAPRAIPRAPHIEAGPRPSRHPQEPHRPHQRLRSRSSAGSDAEPRRRDALALRRKPARPDSPLLADELAGLGRNLLAQNKGSEAEPLLHECLAIRGQAALMTGHYDAMSLLGAAAAGPGRYTGDRAADCARLRRDDGTSGEGRGARSVSAARAAERVVRLYEDWGKAEQATAWKASRAESARRRLRSAVSGPTRVSTPGGSLWLDPSHPGTALQAFGRRGLVVLGWLGSSDSEPPGSRRSDPPS